MLSVRMLSFFILIFSLCDADSICPPEDNPLILSPHEIIEEYGGNPVTVNCSTTLAKHKGMYFTVGNETSHIIEEQMNISQSVSLSDWNVKIKCKVKLNESHECSKDLQVITFKNPEVVYSVQHENVMGKETQYRLQCDIINVAPVQYLTVSWYKNNESIGTRVFNDTIKTPVNVSFILRVNISREENVAQFRCEAQLNFGRQKQKTPAISQTQKVSAHYAPELNTESTKAISSLEGNNITLSCEAVGNLPPVYNWTCDGEIMLENANSLNITRVKHNTTCTCTATNYLGNITNTINVHVEPKGFPLTLTTSEMVVRFGDPVSINCSTSATDVDIMGWEAPFGGTGFEPPPVVTWRVEKLEEWAPSPFCYVTLNNGSQIIVSPLITVYKTPDFVSVSDTGRGPMVEGREHDLKCDVINVAPVQNLTVTWYRGNETVKTETFNDSTMTPVNTSSTLRISTQRDYNGLTFRCEAALHLGPKGPKFLPNTFSPPYTAVVLYKPFMEACPHHVTVIENAAFSIDMLPCQPDGNPPPTVQWFYEEKLINPSKPLTRTDSGKYKAVVENSLGRSDTSVHITVEHSPSFTCKEHYEVTVNDKPQSICEPVGLPTPTLTWFKDGKQVVSPQRWKKNDSGKYLLNAHNTHGTAEHTLYLDILYAPEFKEGNESKEVLQGEDVTLSCSADSNPLSNIRWIYTAAVNSNITTEGHQKIITITRATSTNAGFYVCVAENNVGRNTRFITLMITGNTSKVLFPVIWALLALLIIGLTLLMVYFHNRQKKRGQYSFVPVCQMSNIAQANGNA